jgi:hypothetical protein
MDINVSEKPAACSSRVEMCRERNQLCYTGKRGKEMGVALPGTNKPVFIITGGNVKHIYDCTDSSP